MLEIRRFACEGLEKGCVTDEKKPCFSYSVQSDRQGAELVSACLKVGTWQTQSRCV